MFGDLFINLKDALHVTNINVNSEKYACLKLALNKFDESCGGKN
jgi:hypothetical protein